jgi:outer membrane protein TolC
MSRDRSATLHCAGGSRRRFPALLACLLALPLAGGPLGLSEALRQAGTRSAPADLARLALGAARQDVETARSTYLPELHLAGGYKQMDERPTLLSPPVHLLGKDLGRLESPTEDKASWRWKLSVQYLVYDFGKRASAVSAARLRADALEAGGRAQADAAMNLAASRYLALLNIKAQKRVVAQRRQALEGHLLNVQAQFDHGVVARNDLLRTEVALRQVQDADHALDRAYLSGLEALNVALGVDPARPLELPGGLPAPPACPWSEADCRRKAAESSASVRALGAKVQASREFATSRRRDYCPNVVAEASHLYVQNSFLESQHENAVFLGLSWKVFDASRASKVRKAGMETEQASRELLEARRAAEQAASTSLRAFEQALQELGTAQANVASAEENLRIVQSQYQEGLVRNTDVLDAEAVLADSRSVHAERRYRAYAHQVALLVVLGEDLPAFYDRISPLEGN